MFVLYHYNTSRTCEFIVMGTFKKVGPFKFLMTSDCQASKSWNIVFGLMPAVARGARLVRMAGCIGRAIVIRVTSATKPCST